MHKIGEVRLVYTQDWNPEDIGRARHVVVLVVVMGVLVLLLVVGDVVVVLVVGVAGGILWLQNSARPTYIDLINETA
jgi:hypothetical protein